MPLRTALSPLALAVVLTSCSHGEIEAFDQVIEQPGPAPVGRTVSLETISVPNVPAGSVNERGTILVPLNRLDPDSIELEIEFFRFNRLGEADPDTPPIFLLRGGPGYPGLGDAIENEVFYSRAVQRYTSISDLIIIGQRGFGTSGDLACDAVPPSPWEETNTSEKSVERYRQTAIQCREKYLSAGHPLKGYNVREMADDVADLVNALGYETVQIKGNSFGSFWGITVLRHHPELVERATFSALEGPDHTFDQPGAVKAALEQIAAGAAQSDRYANRMPEEGLIAAYEAMIARADDSPILVMVEDTDLEKEVEVFIDGDALRRFAIGVSTRPIWREMMPDWPDDLLKVIEGNFSELAPRLYRYMRGTDADSAAEEIIECSSGISEERRAEIERDPAIATVGTTPLFNNELCDLWGDAIVEMDRSNFRTSVPTVLIQGTWDVSTPYPQATEVRDLFDTHHFVTVEGGSHGAIFEAEETDPRFASAIDHWYATGDDSLIADRVILPALDWEGTN